MRRTSALLLDRVGLTAESVAALTRALDDEHPQVRRKAVRSLSCEQCKPNSCAVDKGHPAPCPGCRCGIYGAVAGTLDSLPGYLF